MIPFMSYSTRENYDQLFERCAFEVMEIDGLRAVLVNAHVLARKM